MQKLDAVTVTNGKQGRRLQKASCQSMMAKQQAQKPRAVGQVGKQRLQVTLGPAVKGPPTRAFERQQQAQRDDFAGMQLWLGDVWSLRAWRSQHGKTAQ